MILIFPIFTKLLSIIYRAFLYARQIFKTDRNNRKRISNTVYDAYNIPECTFQKVRARANKNKFK